MKQLLPILIILPVALFFAGCEEQDIPLYKPEEQIRTKTISFLFQDKSKETANVAIYVNSALVKGNNTTRGLLRYSIPDSLQQRTFIIALSEYETSDPPASLNVDGLLYEHVLLPEELPNLTAILFTRDNEFSDVKVEKIGISEEEERPLDGHFKIKFYNVSSDPVSIETRNGDTVAGYENIMPYEDRAFVNLPFGSYRFVARRADGTKSGLELNPPLLKGAANKAYTLMIANEAQQISEAKDFGTPLKAFTHLGFVNLIADQAVVLQTIAGSNRTSSAEKPFTDFKNTEMIPAGTTTLDVMIGEERVRKTFEARPWEYVMAYAVEKDGKFDIHIVPYPIGELEKPEFNSEYSYRAFVRFLNFSTVPEASLGSIQVDAASAPEEEGPADVLSPEFTSNIAFGEYPVTDFKTSVNSVYVPFTLIQMPGAPTAPLVIQAYKAAATPFGLGDPLAGTRVTYPFFFRTPEEDVVDYTGNKGESGTYSVILVGSTADDASSVRKARLIVLKHSF